MERYRGITWNHPRGYCALEAASLIWQGRGLEIQWERQSLEDFESRGIEELSGLYDLMVIDHPHVGQAATSGCLHPLESWLALGELIELDQKTVGPVLLSYCYSGRHWALPLDAATQVAAFRPDLIPKAVSLPSSWQEVLEWPDQLILPLAGPHPLLAFFSICVALDEPPLSKNPITLVSTETGEQALDVLIKLFKRMDPVALSLNPIALLNRMATTNAVPYCPLVYGYTNYATAGGMDGHPLFFTNAPVFSPHRRPGSTLGGTGVAVSRRTKITPSLNAYLHWLVAPSTQADFIPSHDGQPCLRAAWQDDGVNARSNQFYLDTLTTMEHSWVRPRSPGYIEFQSAGATAIRSGLLHGDLPSTIFARLTCIAQKSLARNEHVASASG